MDFSVANMALPITILYAGILGAFMVPITMFVGLRRIKKGISVGEGGDSVLIHRMRAHGNFVETVPMALILLMLVELSGGSANLVHGLGIALVTGRVLHYFTLLNKPLAPTRAVGMMLTLGTIAVSSVWLLMKCFG